MIGVTRDGHVTDPGDAAPRAAQRAQRRTRRQSAGGDREGRRRRRPRHRADRRRATCSARARTCPTPQGVAEELPDKAKALNLAIDQAPDPRHRRDQRTGDRRRRHPVDDLRSARRRARGVLPVPRREIRHGAGQLEHPPADVAGRARPGPRHAAGRRAAHRRRRAADRHGQPDRHARRRAGLGRRRSPGSRRWRCSTPSACSTTTAPTRTRGPPHQELFDRAWASQDIIEAQVARIEKRPAELPGRLMFGAGGAT